MHNYLKNYQIVKTQDNSYTVWSERYQEACHSKTGAYSETLYTYINGCKLGEKVSKLNNINILEIGFGIGIGLKVTIDFFSQNTTKQTFKYFAVEQDIDLVKWAIANTNISSPNYPSLKDLQFIKKNGLTYFLAQKGGNEICILIGDARTSVPLAISFSFFPKIHCVYQDAFSPRKNKILWTVEWFKLIKQICHNTVNLSTFSASTSIRKSLYEAGWVVQAVPGMAGKKANTHACLKGEISLELLQKFKRSHKDALYD